MSKIQRLLTQKKLSQEEWQSHIFNVAQRKDQIALEKLLVSKKIQHIADDYKEQILELFQVQNPGLVYAPNFKEVFEKHYKKLQNTVPLWQQGRWVYYPWNSTLVHVLTDKEFQLVRTARNRNLITAEEQDKFYNSIVGIGGLSVGNSVALAIVLQGGARHIRLADHDVLALSNTNRIR